MKTILRFNVCFILAGLFTICTTTISHSGEAALMCPQAKDSSKLCGTSIVCERTMADGKIQYAHSVKGGCPIDQGPVWKPVTLDMSSMEMICFYAERLAKKPTCPLHECEKDGKPGKNFERDYNAMCCTVTFVQDCKPVSMPLP